MSLPFLSRCLGGHTRQVIIAVTTACLAGLSPMRVAAQQGATPFEAALAPLKVIDVTYMDRTANACTDFNAFANGGWLARDTIPATYSSSGVARDMGDRNELVMRSVLDDG